MFCEANKAFIETKAIQEFTNAHILPLVRETLHIPELMACSNHVHIGTDGLEPHDHLPHAFTSVLYVTDAEGAIVLEPCDAAIRIKPCEGRLVVFGATVVHSVDPSHGELRAALVTNYEYPSVP
ncbi:hypothetical protein D3C81_1927520 [compost metagenome]